MAQSPTAVAAKFLGFGRLGLVKLEDPHLLHSMAKPKQAVTKPGKSKGPPAQTKKKLKAPALGNKQGKQQKKAHGPKPQVKKGKVAVTKTALKTAKTAARSLVSERGAGLDELLLSAAADLAEQNIKVKGVKSGGRARMQAAEPMQDACMQPTVALQPTALSSDQQRQLPAIESLLDGFRF